MVKSLSSEWQALGRATRLFAPPPKLTIAQWADEFRRLSPESSAEPGKWRTSKAEYQRGIMEAISDPLIEQVVVISSSQVGKTELVSNTVGYYISHEPSPILLIQPTLEMAETFSKDRLMPMLRDTPILSDKIAAKRSRDAQNTILHKNFSGGHITMAGANSPSSLASRPIRVVICDEVDRYPASAGTEGDPVGLAVKRTTTFWNRKIILVSTPGTKGVSRIEAAYNESDMRQYYVPCPHCGEFQVLIWGQVKWEKDAPDKAWVECSFCQGKMENRHKTRLLRSGEWRIKNEAERRAMSPHQEELRMKNCFLNSKVAGFHINELYSPWLKFGNVVESFLEAKKNKERLKVWVNTSLGETFDEEGGEGLDWENLFKRRESYSQLSVPRLGLFLTSGVDVQNDRVVISVWAWGREESAWLVWHEELYGDPATPEPWQQLLDVLGATFTHETGAELKISASAIDTGFATQFVYNFVRENVHKHKLFAIKGSSTPNKSIIGKPSYQEVSHRGKMIKRGVKLWTIGTDTCKQVIYSRLRLDLSLGGALHFPVDVDEEYFQQLCAEKRVTKYVKGFPRLEWLKTRARNEALDCLVYAYAAASACGMARFNWNTWEENLEFSGAPTARSPRHVAAPRRMKNEEEKEPVVEKKAETMVQSTVRKTNQWARTSKYNNFVKRL